MSKWEKTSLGDVISPAKIVKCGENNYPVLSMTMHDGIVLQSERFKKSLASLDTSEYKVVSSGQLVVGFPIDEGVLYIQNYDFEGIMSPAYDVWNVDYSKICGNYLEYSLHSPQSMQYYASKLRGTTARRRSIPKQDLLSLTFPLPPLETQKQIAANLDKVTRTIDLCKAILEKLDLLVKARFVERFGDIENNIKNYPIVRLGDYAKLQGGYAFKSNEFVENGIPLVQIGNVNKDYLDWEVVNSVPHPYLEKYKDFSLNKGDLVMAMTRPIIKSLNSVKVAKVSENDLPCLLNQRVGRFRLSEKLNEVFIEILCKTDGFKDYVERMSGNSLQPNISSKQVEDYMIILPPINSQNQFAAFVAQSDKSKSAVKQVLEKAETLKKALMQEYFG